MNTARPKKSPGVPGKNLKPIPQAQSDMIRTLLELPGGKPRKRSFLP